MLPAPSVQYAIMRKVRMIIRRTLLIAIGIALLALIVTLLLFQGDFPSAPVTISYVNVDNALVNQPVMDLADPRATVGTDDIYTLHFSTDTSVDVAPGSLIQISHFGQKDDSVQVVISLSKGQISAHVGALTNGRSYFWIRTASGVTVEARQADFLMLADDRNTLIGTRHGNATIVFNNQTFTLTRGSGVTIVRAAPPTAPLPKPKLWATVRVPLFAPDGSRLTMPLTLTHVDSQSGQSSSSADVFYAKSGETLLVPDGIYTPTIKTNMPGVFTLPSVTLPAGQLIEWPVTLSEIQFGVVDSANKPLSGAKLLNVDPSSPGNKPAVLPDTLLVPANKTLNFTLARMEAPDLVQPSGDLSAAPGQHLQIPLRSDLFGGGSLQVSLINPDGSKRATGSVALFTPGTEDTANSTAVQHIKTDETPFFMSRGNYDAVVSFPNSIGRIYPITINANSVTPLSIKLGTLTINYSDNSGRAVSALLYVGSDPDLKRLGQTVDQARNSAYGATLRTGQTLTVPAGDYAFRIDALHSPPAQTVTVLAGQNGPIVVTAVPPSP